MRRRSFLAGLAAADAGLTLGAASSPLPIDEPHFPNRLYQFVWRNWELANLDRMASVVRTTPKRIDEIGRSVGLPEKPRLSSDQLRRIYITVIRQNWHLLPNEQIIALLGWTPERLEFTLQEDDFLAHKLGPKPDCRPVVFSKPTAAEARRASEIRSIVASTVGGDSGEAQPAFSFVERLSRTRFEPLRNHAAVAGPGYVDISGWRVEAGGAVDLGIADRLAEYLRVAMGPVARPAEGKTVRLALGSQEGENFSVDVKASSVEVTGVNTAALLQGVYWLQDRMESAGGPFLPTGRSARKVRLTPRYLYSFFALYGDPLLEPDIDPFPEGYLERLGRLGMEGVWMQAVLSTLAPSKAFPEFGRRSDQRLANLDRFVQRAKRAGLKIYLYINEPRSRPAEFFLNHPEIKGAKAQEFYAMCTTPPLVREWISDSLAHVFARVPELGGVFSITMSENFTNCHSKFRPETCPRCSKRADWEVVGEVLEAIHSGVRRSSKSAEIITWDWGWPSEMARNLIPKLLPGTKLSSVSEWSMPIERGGVRTEIGEYSISVVGPGPRAKAHWALARKAGLVAMAKTQFNNTWEISAVPYIPVPNLVARHAENLLRAGIGGVQASWTLGGYPSPNLEVAKEFYFTPSRGSEEVLNEVATRRYGTEAAPLILEAWRGFSAAFELFPYSVAIYTIPTQHGPANLLRATPTGVRNTMILFPQDDYKSWAGKYPPEVVQREFSRMAALWEKALPAFRRAVTLTPDRLRERAVEDLAIAETCHIHFRSTANQVEFYILRDAPPAAAGKARMREIASDEIELARRQYGFARRHSVIAYEASNNYYYRPADLLEKIVNCRYLLEHVLK
ncbi:MAG: hypothetical protein ABIZ80_23310 [Bryobacteraceae bacterium]